MKYTIILIAVLGLIGCSKLTDVLNVAPPNNLDQDNVVTDAAGARAIVNGVYAQLHDQYYHMYTEMVPSLLTGTMARGTGVISIQFENNEVMPGLTDIRNMWLAFYKMANHANWAIKLVGELTAADLSSAEQAELVGQARGLRAMAHFDALRFFGEFYKLESPFGVVVRDEPGDYTNRYKARNTVAETYQLILEDLDFAILNAPDFNKPVFFSKTAAKALKARVHLYRGEYAQAAALADEVIREQTRTLSPTFAAVFSTGFNSSEMIFMRATDAVTAAASTDRKRFTYTIRAVIAGNLLTGLLEGDPRQAYTFNAVNRQVSKVDHEPFFRPTYLMRLSELYLIKAEGLARSGASLTDAKEPLESIVSRALGEPYGSPATTADELLDEIYNEIIRELSFENGSDWFASLRFGKISQVKPTVTRESQYILPIPQQELDDNLSFGPQNPGY